MQDDDPGTSALWNALLAEPGRAALAEALPRFLGSRRWFGGKARPIRAAALSDAVPVTFHGRTFQIGFADVDYGDGGRETYLLPLGVSTKTPPDGPVIASLDGGQVYDASGEPSLASALLTAVVEGRTLPGRIGAITGVPTTPPETWLTKPPSALRPSLMSAEQSNTSVLFDRDLILKLIRRLEPGPNPEIEVGAFLAGPGAFPHAAPVRGLLEYRADGSEATCIGVLLAFVPHAADAWRYTLDSLAHYFDSPGLADRDESPPSGASLLDLSRQEPPTSMGAFADSVQLLGRRLAELHLALAGADDDPAFRPEPFDDAYQRRLCSSMVDLARAVGARLRERLASLPEPTRTEAERLLDRWPLVAAITESILSSPVNATRGRHHGDLHLGQVLWTGSDFVIVDFEGEPARPLHTRRVKHSPLRDVAGMLRSFHYAAFTAAEQDGAGDPGDRAAAQSWYRWIGAAFLGSYLRTGAGAPFLPADERERRSLLSLHLLEKAVYELGYELDNRPAWVHLPLRGIAEILDDERGPR